MRGRTNLNEVADVGDQIRRHAVGRTGEEIAQQVLGGELTPHKAPFDIVDWENRIAYEVKTFMSTVDKRNIKVHIDWDSFKKKRKFIKENQPMKAYLILLVWDQDNEKATLYRGTLKQWACPGGMKLIKQDYKIAA
jgi:hypothetical protein